MNEQQEQADATLRRLKQTLERTEALKDVQGQALALHQMAIVYTQQGQTSEALQYFQQSLALKESLGDVQGQAATLAYMAYLAGQVGEIERAVELYRQAAQFLGQVRAYGELVRVLANLAATAKEQAQAYLAQALWLCLRVQVTLEEAMSLIMQLYQVSQGDELEMLLGAIALFLCASQDEALPALPQFREAAMRMLSAVANAQGVDSEAAFNVWLTEQQLNDPEVVLPRLMQCLETTIGDTWLFEHQSSGG